MKVIYEGIFIAKEEILAIAEKHGERLAKVIEHPHVTTRFKPIYTMNSLYGTPCDIIITAHGCNGKNEGFKVHVVSDDEAINRMVGQVEHPHITISVSEDGKPVDTAKLVSSRKMRRCKEVVKVKGVFGAFTPEGVITGMEEF